MEKKKNILVISRSAWRNDNNTGNTLSSFFDFQDHDSIANVYCREELPQNNICHKYLQISEKKMLLKLTGKKVEVSKSMTFDAQILEKKTVAAQTEKNVYNFFNKYRFTIFLWLRELIWATNLWKDENFRKFIKDFQPDIIYSAMHDSIYMYNVLLYIHKITHKPIVTFHGDDHIVLNGSSWSPFYWINKCLVRRKVFQVLKKSSLDFVISEEQKKIYEKKTNKQFLILKKTKLFRAPTFKHSFDSNQLNFVFTGNIIYGRIHTLMHLGKEIEKFNQENQTQHTIKIYTHNNIDENLKSSIDGIRSIKICPPVSSEEVYGILSENDILLHVEATDKKMRMLSHLSFSTKIIDYLEVGRPIVAIGWAKSASINYLNSNQIGYCMEDERGIEDFLKNVSSKQLLDSSIKAYEFGKENHSKNNFFEQKLDNL